MIKRHRRRPACRDGTLCPQITDIVRETTTGLSSTITGFFREAGPQEAGRGRLLVPCAPFHENLCLLRLAGETEDFLRPWRVEWARRASWPADDIDRAMRRYYGDECETHISSLVDIGPGSTVRLNPPLSAHEVLELAAWRRRTHVLIEAWTTLHSPADAAA